MHVLCDARHTTHVNYLVYLCFIFFFTKLKIRGSRLFYAQLCPPKLLCILTHCRFESVIFRLFHDNVQDILFILIDRLVISRLVFTSNIKLFLEHIEVYPLYITTKMLVFCSLGRCILSLDHACTCILIK